MLDFCPSMIAKFVSTSDDYLTLIGDMRFDSDMLPYAACATNGGSVETLCTCCFWYEHWFSLDKNFSGEWILALC